MDIVQNKRGRYLSIAVIRNTFISSTVMATYINKCNCLTFDLLSSVGQFLSLKQKNMLMSYSVKNIVVTFVVLYF